MIAAADVVDALWAQVEPHVFLTREEFVQNLDGWSIEPVERDGVLAFAVLTKGPELHFASFGTGRAISLRMIRARVQPLIDAHGFARVLTPKDDARQRRFNEAIGFVAESEDEIWVRYRMDLPVWARRHACPS